MSRRLTSLPAAWRDKVAGGASRDVAPTMKPRRTAPRYDRVRLLPVEGTGNERFVVFVADWHPAPLNSFVGSNHMKAARLKKRDAGIVCGALWAAGVTRAICRRRLELVIHLGPGQRGCDPDAYFKSLNDGLQLCGALVQDSRHGVELPPVEFAKGSGGMGTTIILTDLSGKGCAENPPSPRDTRPAEAYAAPSGPPKSLKSRARKPR